MRRLPLVAAVLLFAAGGAWGQVYKCTQGGETVFTDKPCAQAGQQVRAAAGAGAVEGSIDFQVPTRHYKVSGATIEAAYRMIRASNPGGFAGFARWKVNYRYDSFESAGSCRIGRVAVQVVGDILMPEWVEEAQASQAEQARWRSMYTALKRHEDGHVQHGREFALLLKERLLGLGAVPCAELESRARQEYRLLYGNLQKRDQEYDRRTEHGLRQDNPH